MNTMPTNCNINDHLAFKSIVLAFKSIVLAFKSIVDAIMTSKEHKVKQQQPTLTQMYAVGEMKQAYCEQHNKTLERWEKVTMQWPNPMLDLSLSSINR